MTTHFYPVEGLRNKTLHIHLYPKKHATLNACCIDAMDYDNNFDMSNIANRETKKDGKSLSADSSSQTLILNSDQIVVSWS